MVRDARRRAEWTAPRSSGPRRVVPTPSRSREARDFRLLFDATPLPAWVYDAETLRFIAVNRAAVEHYGYSEAEFLENTILLVRPPEDAERVLDFAHDAPGYARVGNFRHRRKDGALIDVETISYGFELDGRKVRFVVINDVSEQLQIREQQEQLQAQLLLAQKMDAVGDSPAASPTTSTISSASSSVQPRRSGRRSRPTIRFRRRWPTSATQSSAERRSPVSS